MLNILKHYLIKQGYIPLDKSWIIRMGILDLLNGYDDTTQFIKKQEQLSDDLKALYRASLAWKSDEPIDVGESGTLYRFLRFASWKLDIDKEFILHGSLKQREICDNPEIVNYSLDELLKLDNGTSQWASASVLLGSKERIPNPPYKLRLSYEAVSHWKKQRKKGHHWEPRYDETILRQAIAFLELLKKGETSFIPQQPEDYCFARAFELITKEDGELRWPSLRGHESNRIAEMERVLCDTVVGKEINSRDHRIVQAIAMLRKVKGKDIKVKYPEVVKKSWPQFWKFLKDSLNILIK